jgi:outer membrane cobalamin receptor
VGTRADRSFDPDTFAATRQELPGYLLWTLGGEWDVLPVSVRFPSLAVSVRAENLLGESYEEAWGFVAPGRQIYLGLSMGLGGGA